ncbi:SAICAR synthase-like protein [Backusella circina FSU 941]|nr:SAICAR synthase-like protein [Backusella circina FSU 941]
MPYIGDIDSPFIGPKRHSTSYSTTTKKQIQQQKRRSLLSKDPINNSVLKRSQTANNTEGLTEEFQKELSARQKAFRRLSRRRHSEDEDKVLMGTRISEGHQNYVLMYNMLTGIRIAVGRVSAKPNRTLNDADFTAAHKLAFDVTGDELTPGAKYDFKFKDYAPWVFRGLRERFGIDPADYLISLTSKYILSELGSPGKSGSFFYYSRDYRFIIKTIHHTEHKFMRKILKDYYNHVSSNPDTLLCRYYGLHRVKLPRGRKIHFVVMGNVLPPNKDIHETYDLKGSTLGRFLPEEEIRKNPYAVMKDLNWTKRGKKLQLGPYKRKLFTTQLLRDVKLLARMNIMDYSLMIGVHDIIRGNKENVRNSTLQSFQPDTRLAERRASMMKRRESKAMVYRKVIMEANPDKLNMSELPDIPFDERRNCVFYSDNGGFQATDESNKAIPSLYFMGIIDILTPYDIKKKSEHFIKAMTQNKNEISAVKPSIYGNRFMKFMTKTLEHHEDVPREYQLDTNEKKLN